MLYSTLPLSDKAIYLPQSRSRFVLFFIKDVTQFKILKVDTGLKKITSFLSARPSDNAQVQYDYIQTITGVEAPSLTPAGVPK